MNNVRKATIATAILLAGGLGQAAQAEVKVGLMLPATGTYAALGKAIENGFKLYVEEQGGKLGGQQIQYFAVDDESETGQGTREYQPAGAARQGRCTGRNSAFGRGHGDGENCA
ncbi:extracellular ligand-binding receptor [Advenella kashmirensis WT001]|uniref:Extracellular ligand-binding receptor n=1 Tax=Advenella kashmirensis (strain DSM 17095 / LMG 22695 / WT001) TaxID=1036672 RepID=I3UA92_ADVKW|nr:extracellular ligand-binding receptor [Advenella kashmirensis WT001]